MSKLFSESRAILESELPPATRLLLLTLRCHTNDLGEVDYLSIGTLVKETGLSYEEAVNNIQIADEAGWL